MTLKKHVIHLFPELKWYYIKITVSTLYSDNNITFGHLKTFTQRDMHREINVTHIIVGLRRSTAIRTRTQNNIYNTGL